MCLSARIHVRAKVIWAPRLTDSVVMCPWTWSVCVCLCVCMLMCVFAYVSALAGKCVIFKS